MAGPKNLLDHLRQTALTAAFLCSLLAWGGQARGRDADDLIGCSPGERAAIEALCSAERGSIAQRMCRSNQVTGLLRTARKPDLSVATPAERVSISDSCANKSVIGERFECERSRLTSAGLPVRDEPGAGVLHALTASLTAPLTTVAPTPPSGFGFFNLEKWRRQRPGIPPEYTGATLSPERLFQRISPSVYIVVASDDAFALATEKPRAQGGAVAISGSILLTNCHILAGRPQITIVQQGDSSRATLVYADPAGDRCFLRAAVPLHPVPGIRRFADLMVGERVFSVGAPSGYELSFGEGVVSGLRDLEGVRYVQNSALSWYGSSGGGLFDARGNLVGISTAMNTSIPNQNFAIAAEDFWP